MLSFSLGGFLKGLSMYKRLMVILITWTSCVSSAFAVSFYIVPSVQYDSFYSKPVRYEGVSPKVAVGVGSVTPNPFSIDAELWAAPINPLTIHNRHFTTPGLRPSYSYGIGILPSYRLDNVIRAYLRLGAVSTHFKDLGVTRAAWQAGAGAEVSFDCLRLNAWAVRAEWNYAKYQSISGIGNVSDGEYTIGGIYRFG